MKRKITAMHEAYGIDAGHICRDCINFVRYRYHDRSLLKCKIYGLTHSEASDWAGSWMACGYFGKPLPDSYRPLIEVLKRGSKTENEPLEGQIMFEEKA